MAIQRESDNAQIRRRIERLVEAVRAMDLERVKPIYAADIVSFDLEPPLRHLGAEAKWGNWEKAFAAYQAPLSYETHDLEITVGGDVAFGRCLAHISGTLKAGRKTGYWVRWTSCFRKIEGEWRIVHDQISVPTDLASGRALLDLEP